MRLKGSWQVFSGVVPGNPQPELTKTWFYTVEDYEVDLKKAQDENTFFTEIMLEVHEYAKSLTDPRVTNWVRCEWVWL